MIPGIVAAAGSGASGGGSSYPGATAVADFLLGEYFIGENEVTAAAMIANPALIDGSGLYINWDVAGAFTQAIGDFLAALIAADWTLIIEVTEDDGGTMHPLTLTDESTGGGSAEDDIIIASTATGASVTDDVNVPPTRFVSVSGLAARPAVRRIAVTRNNSKLVMSANGSAINSDATASATPSLNKVLLGADDGDTFPLMKGHIRRIIIYPVQPDSELPTLSTP